MAAKDTTAQRRTYVILRHDDADLWQKLGEADAQNDKQAIANLLAGDPSLPQEGVFSAVSTRSWKPVTRAVQTVTKASWS